MRTVYNKEELKRALEAKEYEIIIKGELAKKIRQKAKIKKIAIGTGLASIVAAPFTGGISLGVGAAAVSGGTIAIIAILCGFSLALIGILNGYDVEFLPNGAVRLTKK